MKIVAVEEHLLTPAVGAAWDVAARASGDGAGASMHQGEVGARLEDVAAGRLARMDENGVDVQVLSLTSPGLGHVDAAVGVALARETNDFIAATVAARPDRFEGFATIAATAPTEAAAELERCVLALGMKGAMLFGRAGVGAEEKPLDHPDYLPLFAKAAALRVPLFLHPQTPPKAVREAYYSGFSPEVDLAFANFGIGWHYDCGVQFLRLALAGVFDRFPELQMVLGHWGELVLFYADRLKSFSRVTKLQRPVVDVLRENVYVTASGMFSPSYFAHAVEVVGIDRVLFSTDYPYQFRPGRGPRAFLEALPVSEAEKAKIAHGNWERLTAR